MVEFALLLPIVIVALAALVEVTVVARAQLEVTHAAREGARQAATAPDPAAAVAAVHASLGDPLAGRAIVSVQRPHVVGAMAKVAVRLPFRVATPLLGGFVVELRSSATMRVER